MADYYPTREDELIAWHNAFSAAVSSYSAALGLAPAVVTQVSTDATTVGTCLGYLAQAQQFAEEVVAFKNQVLHGALNTPAPPFPTVPAALTFGLGWLPNIEDRTRQLVNQIKANGAFTPQMGQDMGIFGVSAPAGVVSVDAQALSASQVAITVAKAGYDVVVVDSRRGGGAWEQIATLTTASTTDARPPIVAGQPEQREYRCQGFENNQRTGPISSVVSVVTVP